MLLSLGMFVFQLQTIPYETLKRDSEYRWSGTARIGKAPARQFLGPGDEDLTIDGRLIPELTGGMEQLTKLREMAAKGKAWILTAGTGDVLGKYVITKVSDDQSHFLGNGVARRISFSIGLKRYENDDNRDLGKLMDSKP
tara:strand:+ start:66795 stop:67214 length:420 start_codon:yes stop_codon:yes gene_type:complete